MGFQKKAHHVAILKPEIAVIPECGKSSESHRWRPDEDLLSVFGPAGRDN